MNLTITEIKDYVLIISGIGTFLSALVAAWTIIEIKKQRRSSYLPDIILDTYTAFFYWKRDFSNESMFEFKRSQYNERQKNKEELKKYIYLEYQLQNIGLGVAKYIDCNWKFDYKKAIQKLKGVLPEGYQIELSKETITLKKGEEDYIDFLYFSDLDSDRTDFILPESQYLNNKESCLPKLAISLYTYYLIFKYGIYLTEFEEYNYESFDEFPRLSMEVSYKDIRNKTYKKKFELSFSFAETRGHPQQEEDELGIYYINVEEK